MAGRKETWRFWFPFVGVLLFAVYIGFRLTEAHLAPEVADNTYTFTIKHPARRGTITCSGRTVVESVPQWRYSLDPPSITNGVFRRKKGDTRTPERIREDFRFECAAEIAKALKLKRSDVIKMAFAKPRPGWRSQFLAESDDPEAYAVLTDSTRVRGVAISDMHMRRYLNGRMLSHVLGSVNAEGMGSCGIEQKYNFALSGVPGEIVGYRDGRGNELRERRMVSVPPTPGDTIDLTIDMNLQHEAEMDLRWGLAEFGAASGWCVILDAKTAAVRALVSLPDFDPSDYGRASDYVKVNRAVGFNYEPGSVMKAITAAAVIDAGRCTPSTMVNTDRLVGNYYNLPRDAGHVWPERMSLKEGIIHSSNIVIGKLAYDFGPQALHAALKRFGFGAKTNVGLPGEEVGILRDWRRWDKASWSRVGIGQGVSVTAIQLAGAYQALANDGIRMCPYIINSITNSKGVKTLDNVPRVAGQSVKASTARAVREMMLGVTEWSLGGTARRGKVKGYSVAGKTGTAQKVKNGNYLPGLYCASFCGIIPSGLPQERPDGSVFQSDPELVILVSLDFDERRTYHQGGNSSAVVFRRLAQAAMRYCNVSPDRPDELENIANDEYEAINAERTLNRLER